MPVINRFADWHDEAIGWRHHLHRNPELMYDVQDTAAFVAERLRDFGCDEIVEGIGRTGVVGIIKGNAGDGPTIGLRSDMDALPITEDSGKAWASQNPGKMHACGHDGHITMLLSASRYLAETRNFAGTIAVIFQPAEEGGAGGKAMVDDGMMDRFGIVEVYGMHNMPGLPVGEFAICTGPIMASTSQFTIIVEGRGGHAAKPDETIDPVVTAAHIVTALQSIVARNVDPMKNGVVSVTAFQSGKAYNIIPQSAELRGTVRALDTGVNDLIERRIRELVPGIAGAFGATTKIGWHGTPYPVTINHPDQTDKAVNIARMIAGEDSVNPDVSPVMGGEDFAFMLQARPGAFIFLGAGDTAGLHNPAYDFNDDAIPHGASYWARLAETLLAAA
ncbi:MAG: M20 aminoacylase family protein [Alphaproteobacteria bacterium]